VRFEFEDEELEHLAFEPDFRIRRWSQDVTHAYRRVINLISSASSEHDLRQFKGLRLEKLKGKRAGTSSVRINDQYRLVLRFQTDDDGRLAVIIEAVDYH
jgi:proteic killer suppression protein